jgi:outer membrane exchange protein TraA
MSRRKALALAGLLSFAAASLPATAGAAPVMIPTPVADALMGQGQGLCSATAISMSPAQDFPQQSGVFNAGLNAFMEAHKLDRVEYVQRTIFDLSNNYVVGVDTRSYGDFLNSMTPTCQTGGCDFHLNDSTTAFGARYRGFLNVTSNLAQKPVHIGFYADDAVSLVIFDKNGNGYNVVIQPPVLGIPTWRVTETVTFGAAGLYPIEILYAEIADHAALEMSLFDGTFTDFQRSINDPMGVNLKTAGFKLFEASSFFQTLSGQPSYPNLDQCKQCDRQFVGQIGNNGCDMGYYCNEAALCAPCDTAVYCGPTCSPCGGMTPFCINVNQKLTCSQCRDDNDCKQGFSCDPVNHTCNECNQDPDCPRGKYCDNHVCTTCDTPEHCAGNSCNCCPKGSNGKQMQCVVLDPANPEPPECIECLHDSDCGTTQRCDLNIGQCLDTLPPITQEQPKSCGDQHVDCTAQMPPLPLCLPGPFGEACAECRQDMECGTDSSFCLSGQCTPCLTDHRCGKRCETCGGDTPYCMSAQRVEDVRCVRCNKDEECVGGTCDQMKHECTSSCQMSCAPATPYCDGQACVECYADTQCPCNGTCDLTAHTCSASCKDNGECLGDQHCEHTGDGTTKDCAPGPLPDNVDCGSTLADACSNSIGSRGQNPTPAGGLAGLAILSLLLRRRRRARATIHHPSRGDR